MKRIGLFSIWLLLVLTTISGQVPRVFSSTELGVSITPPKVEPTFNQAFLILTFSLEPISGFSANVNLQYQPFSGTMAEYDKLSSIGFEQMNIEVISKKLTTNTAVYEYRGIYQEQVLHWYSVAKAIGGKIYLATATSLDSLWEQQKNVLKASVDSLELDKTLGHLIEDVGVRPLESDFWKLLSEIDKIIFVRGLLQGMVSEKMMQYLLLKELEAKPSQISEVQKQARSQLADEFIKSSKAIQDRISKDYQTNWQRDCMAFIDMYYSVPKNIEETLSTAYFYFLNNKYGWGYVE